MNTFSVIIFPLLAFQHGDRDQLLADMFPVYAFKGLILWASPPVGRGS
jgi:hypothetical protein